MGSTLEVTQYKVSNYVVAIQSTDDGNFAQLKAQLTVERIGCSDLIVNLIHLGLDTEVTNSKVHYRPFNSTRLGSL